MQPGRHHAAKLYANHQRAVHQNDFKHEPNFATGIVDEEFAVFDHAGSLLTNGFV